MKGYFGRLRITIVKEWLAALYKWFQGLTFVTKVIAIAILLGLFLALILVLVPGGETTPPVTTTPPPTTTPTPTPTPEIPTSGSGTASAEVADNPGEHPALISGPLALTWNIDGSTITIGGFPNIGELTGTLAEDGTFSATGSGTYSGYSVNVIFNGIITLEGINGMLIVGSSGGLPGGLAIWFLIALLFA